ncbi:MAG: hypothetical protein BroJett011_07760 [Chloroflexota bacterium]|nr:MAG: hypothetical protein BroJett011_07760 [Chloroflexota bacterium]
MKNSKKGCLSVVFLRLLAKPPKDWLENRLYATLQQSVAELIKDEPGQGTATIEFDFVVAED